MSSEPQGIIACLSGLQVEHVFQVVFIEPSFGDVYDHD